MSSNLKRAKVYFFVMASLMTLTLLVFSYLWNVPRSLTKLYGKEEHLPAVREPDLDSIKRLSLSETWTRSTINMPTENPRSKPTHVQYNMTLQNFSSSQSLAANSENISIPASHSIGHFRELPPSSEAGIWDFKSVDIASNRSSFESVLKSRHFPTSNSIEIRDTEKNDKTPTDSTVKLFEKVKITNSSTQTKAVNCAHPNQTTNGDNFASFNCSTVYAVTDKLEEKIPAGAYSQIVHLKSEGDNMESVTQTHNLTLGEAKQVIANMDDLTIQNQFQSSFNGSERKQNRSELVNLESKNIDTGLNEMRETNPNYAKYQQLSLNISSPRNFKTFNRVRNNHANFSLFQNKLNRVNEKNPFYLHLQNMQSIFYNSNEAGVTERPDVCQNCFHVSFNELINEPNLCQENTFLLILITSVSTNKEARNAIRLTWGQNCNSHHSLIRCAFVFGNNKDLSSANADLQQESHFYHDILQFDFHDSYANLTYKTMSSLKWSYKYCQQAKYVMKSDDDMYVNTELLPLMLKAAPEWSFIGGFCWGASPPHRDRRSKWFVSFKQYSHPRFPAMCSGTGYVMSRDMVSDVLDISRNIPFFHLEDVYVAICVHRLKFRPVTLDGFWNTLQSFYPCTYRNSIMTSHEISPVGLIYAWKMLHTCPLNVTSLQKNFVTIQ